MKPARLLAALLLLAASCTERAAPPSAPVPSPQAQTCRVGPDGGPPAPTAPTRTSSTRTPSLRTAAASDDDRGIGGTGIQLASAEEGGDRGIGGTGIVGVVTGFASICVNGLHVAYDPMLPVAFGEMVAPPSALRVGQVVVISADGPPGALQAQRVAVRYEVSGPVEAVEPGALRVAGQRVTLVGAVPGGTDWKVGDTVLVSGLRAPDGSIIASRIDPRPAGAPRTVTVYGVLMQREGILSVGNLPIRVGPGLLLPDPGPVIATGMIENGVLIPVSVAPDMLLRDPTVWFGPGYDRFFYDGYVSYGAGVVTLGSALRAPGPAGVAPFSARRGVVELRPGPGGGVTAAGLRDPAGAPIMGGPLGGLRQAPMPGGFGGRSGGPFGNPGGGPSGGPSGGRGAPRGEAAPMPDRRLDRSQPSGAGDRGPGAAGGDRSGGERTRRDRPDSEDRSSPSGSFQGGGPFGGSGQGSGGYPGGGPQSIGPQGGGFFGRGR